MYFDPPYGIRYGSNFQPFVNKRDVRDGKDEDLTTEPEMVKAFRDTWELEIHSYLSYLRDWLRLPAVVREGQRTIRQKYPQLYREKEFGRIGASANNRVELPDGQPKVAYCS